MEVVKELSQTGEFASNLTVTIKTEKGVISNVRILGPVRNYTQVEISKTDAFKLGVNPPVRASGNLKDSAPITIVGPKGVLNLNEGCIIADRHIHITPNQLKEFNLENREEVSIRVNGIKGGILENVHLKVDENSYFELHLDTDDANSHLISDGDIVEIIK